MDVDGIVADFVGRTIELLPDVFPSGRDSITSWSLYDGLSPENQKRCQDTWHSKGFCMSLPVLPGSQNAVDRISMEADIIWVTSPLTKGHHWVREREMWLERYFAALPGEIVFAHDKSLVSGNLLVDDRSLNLQAWVERNPGGMGVLWDSPWNSLDSVNGVDMVRASGWGDVLRLV